MNKLIASMIRVFHILFWLFLFCGVLLSRSMQVNMVCVIVIMVGIMLWEILGYCFVNVLENEFDPSRMDGTPADASLIHEYMLKNNLDPRYLEVGFKYLIYIILFIGLFRIYCFIHKTRCGTFS